MFEMFSRRDQGQSKAVDSAGSVSAELATLAVGGRTLSIVKTRRKKSIGMKANGQTLELHVPKHLSERALQKVLDSHRDWIHKRLHAFEAKSQTPFQFQPNDPLDFLGERFTFFPSACRHSKQIEITCEAAHFKLIVPENRWSKTDLKPLLMPAIIGWYTEHAVDYFEQKMPIYAQKIGVEYTQIQVKNYKSRWGSCYSDGRIQFNWKLMQAPSWVIDYVIVHELCHLIHANHSSAFWSLVERHYPCTLEAKRWLKTHQHRLIQFLS